MNMSRNRSTIFLVAVVGFLMAPSSLVLTLRPQEQPIAQHVPAEISEGWTAGSAFKNRLEGLRKQPKAVRVLEARARLTTPEGEVEVCEWGLFTLRQKQGAYEIELVRAQGDAGEFRHALRQQALWSMEASSELSQRTVRLTGEEEATLDLEIRRLSEDLPLPQEVVDSWAYTTALLEADPPVSEEFDEEEQERSTSSEEASQEFWERLQQVRQDEGELAGAELLKNALDERTLSRYDRSLREEAQHAAQSGQAELAFRIYRYYIPVGGCSMDQMPRLVAEEYADLCLQQNRLGCFLQLQVQMIGDQFERVAYSSIAARMNDTAAARLEQTGIDVDRFLLGLMFDVQSIRTRRMDVHPQRLARGMIEAGRVELLRPRLEALVQDGQLDEWNRTLAASTLLTIRLYDLHLDDRAQGTHEELAKKQVASVLSDFGVMNLPPAFATLLQSLRESE